MSCVFCAIVAGEVPSRRVHEDEHAVAFLDLAPLHRGHTLVVPRRHVASLLDGEPAMAEIGACVDATARLLVDRLDADGLNVVSSAGAAAGQEVFHLHVHLLPRYAQSPGLAHLLGARAPSSEADLDAVHASLTGRR
ncbi:HIT family protein [Microlunatus lacustris]